MKSCTPTTNMLFCIALLTAGAGLWTGCSAMGDDARETDTETEVDTATEASAERIREAIDALLDLAPQACTDFCQNSVDCQFAVGELGGSHDHIDIVYNWSFENCVMQCTYPLIEGSYLYATDGNSGEQTVERIVTAEEYTAFAECLQSLNSNRCVDGAFDLNLDNDLTCGGFGQCLAIIVDYQATCQWSGAPDSGDCSCEFPRSIPDLAPWVAGAMPS